MNVAYVGVDNPIRVAVENVNAKDIVLSTDNGTIRMMPGANCIYNPEIAGDATITISVKTKSGLRRVGEQVVRVRDIPVPIARFPGIGGSSVRLQVAPVARLENFDFDVKFTIYRFKFTVIRNSQIIFEREHYDLCGAKFVGDMEEALGRMRPGDKLILEDIYAIGPCGVLPKLNDIVAGLY
jgi:hypothetical protein